MRALPSEKAIQAAILDHWRKLGVEGSLVFAIPNAGAFGQPGLTRGPFDLCCIGGNVTLGFIELKRSEKDKLRPEQETFRKLLVRHGISYAVTDGRDQPIQVLERWGIVRQSNSMAATRSGCAGDGEGARRASPSPDPLTSSPRRAGAPA